MFIMAKEEKLDESQEGKLEEITKLEFEVAWDKHLAGLDNTRKKALNNLNSAIVQYNAYVYDEKRYIIKYFMDSSGLISYTKTTRDPIGF